MIDLRTRINEQQFAKLKNLLKSKIVNHQS